VKVRELKKQHLDEVRSLGSPPEAIKVVLAGIVILCTDYIKEKGGIIVQTNPQTLKKEENYFKTSQMYLLSDTNDLLKLLMNYDKDNINPRYIEKLERVCKPHPKFNEADATNASKAIGYLFGWLKAMYDYFHVFITTQPLRDKLSEVRKIVELKTEELRKKKEALEEINAKIDVL